MSQYRREARITDNFSQVPHGLWTAPLSWGAKSLLGWLHSHDDRYLSRLTNNRIRAELGASGQVGGWVKELTEAGFIAVERNGQRNRFILMAAPWEALATRRAKPQIEDEKEPTDNRSVRTEVEELTDYRSETDRLPVSNRPNIGYIEHHVAHQRADHLSLAHPNDAQLPDAQPSEFATFWALYPRRKDRKRSESAFRRLTKAERQAVLDALPAHIAHWQRERTELHFIPHPTTWLNGRRWEDDLGGEWHVEPERKHAPGMGAVQRLMERSQNTEPETRLIYPEALDA